jgi:hypothetical protein
MSSKDPLAAHKVPAAVSPLDTGAADALSESQSSSDPPSVLVPDKAGKQKSAKPPVEPPLAVPPAPAPLAVYEVLTQCTVSWGGQTLTLKPGKLFSEASHGPNIEQRMADAGVEFRKVVG